MESFQITSNKMINNIHFQEFYQRELEKQLFQFLSKYYEKYSDHIDYLQLIRTFKLSGKSIKKMELKFDFSYINLLRGDDDYQMRNDIPSYLSPINTNNFWPDYSVLSFDFYNNPKDMETLREINSKNDYSMNEISSHPSVDFDLVLKYPDFNWKYGDFELNYYDNYSNIWIREGLSSNPNITIDIISNHQKMPWNYYVILKTYKLDADNFENVLSFCKTKLQEKNEYREPNFYAAIANNSTLTYELLKLHPEIEWSYNCYEVFSKYKDIPLEYIYEKIDKFIITHCNYTFDKYEEYGVPIFKNPNMTFDMLSSLIDNKVYPYMDDVWHSISINDFNKQKGLIWNECCNKLVQICKIQEWWMNIYWNPCSSICKKRLYKEYDELVKTFENLKEKQLEWNNQSKLSIM